MTTCPIPRLVELATKLTPPAAFAILAAVALEARGQSTMWTFSGIANGDRHGSAVSDVGDVDGDGFADVLVGAPFEDVNGSDSGRARVFSGMTGSVLRVFDGSSLDDQFGITVRSTADVTGDGIREFMVGAALDDNNASNSGSVTVFSGAPGPVVPLFVFNGAAASDGLYGCADAGDVNDDGTTDFLCGAEQASTGGTGYVRVFSGVDGGLLYAFVGASAGDRFGSNRALDGVGDLNGDGFDDVVAGGPAFSVGKTGYAEARSGADGSVLYTRFGDSGGDAFGRFTRGVGDLDGDSTPDWIAGASQGIPSGAGYVRAFSGIDGSTLFTAVGNANLDYFGTSGAGIGDLDQDGVPELAVGATRNPFSGVGYARVVNGATGAGLYSVFASAAGDHFGVDVSGAGDVDADLRPDLVVGAPGHYLAARRPGYARVYAGCIKVPPAVAQQPQGATVCAGAIVTLSVVATGGAPLGYQWRKDGTPIPGAQNSSYTLLPVMVSDDGVYDVVVSNTCGSTTSNPANLEVHPLATITEQPSDVDECPGVDFTLSVSATSALPLTYQWRKDGVDLPGETGTTYTVVFAQVSDSGSYDCVVTNCSGPAVSDAATVSIAGTFVSYGSGKAGSVCTPVLSGSGCPKPGESVTFTVSSALGGSTAVFLLGTVKLDPGIPALGGTLLVVPAGTAIVGLAGSVGTPCVGSGSLPFTIPPNPLLTGLSLSAQAWVIDPGATYSIAMSQGVEMNIG